MADSANVPEQLVDVLAPLLGLTIEPEYRPGVIANMERNVKIAQLVMEFTLPDEIEVAPVFQP
ncbi:MAG TPA: DUF4089 domain-containing protein [Coleofasciculaceae cyanobacterium]